MQLDEIKAALNRALPLRPPTFKGEEEDLSPRRKIELLEDYLMESAYVAAELEEALHWTDALVAHFKAKVEQITGYEVALPGKAQDRITQGDILAAKRTVDRPTFEAGAEAKQLRDSMLRQIERLRFEEQWIISRSYSMVSGG